VATGASCERSCLLWVVLGVKGWIAKLEEEIDRLQDDGAAKRPFVQSRVRWSLTTCRHQPAASKSLAVRYMPMLMGIC
jgi:hypothetical protein